jgi:hypothetical protein
MKILFNILVFTARIYLIIKFLCVLVGNTFDPESYPLGDLEWFLYFLVFDIWLNTILKDIKMEVEEKID